MSKTMFYLRTEFFDEKTKTFVKEYHRDDLYDLSKSEDLQRFAQTCVDLLINERLTLTAYESVDRESIDLTLFASKKDEKSTRRGKTTR